ncbi:reverse transcriptase family protein [Streptomyces rimosus]|uniref:reverse transcriptase family protein n=1 Tax=Streptomyces rimosus TaxID=1927 RepID=UPI00131CD94D|nr:reverse transcriptase family protein [Streptomyces rimosus]
MPYSVHDLAQQAGVSVEVLERLSSMLPAGAGQLYVQRIYRKKHGGIREIFKPKPPFDAIGKNLHRSFTSLFSYEAPDHVHGFVRGRSTISNASQHLAKGCVLRMDLEDFFPSIDAATIKASLQERGYEEKAADFAVNLVTIGGKLPIGLSTSPLLSNLIFLSTDRSLAEYAQSEGLSFTRYVDDLAFSGDVTDRHSADIARILDDAGWSVNTRKTAFMRRGGPQYVTGLYVGESDGPRIPRKVKRKMRWILHAISKFGYETYMTEFGGEDEGMRRRRLLGWACYIAEVEPDVGYPLLRGCVGWPWAG